MRKKNVKLSIWIDEEEKAMLKKNSAKVGLTQSNYLRFLIRGYKPKEQPTDEIFEMQNQLRGIGKNMNQIARKANSLGLIDAPNYKYAYEKFKKFEEKFTERFFDME